MKKKKMYDYELFSICHLKYNFIEIVAQNYVLKEFAFHWLNIAKTCHLLTDQCHSYYQTLASTFASFIYQAYFKVYDKKVN